MASDSIWPAIEQSIKKARAEHPDLVWQAPEIEDWNQDERHKLIHYLVTQQDYLGHQLPNMRLVLLQCKLATSPKPGCKYQAPEDKPLSKFTFETKARTDYLDTKEQVVELLITVEPNNGATDRDIWERAFDYFLEQDNLEEFIEGDNDFYHSRDKGFLSGTRFEFKEILTNPAATPITAQGGHYQATESRSGDYSTYTDQEGTISTAKVTLAFVDPAQAEPFFAKLLDPDR